MFALPHVCLVEWIIFFLFSSFLFQFVSWGGAGIGRRVCVRVRDRDRDGDLRCCCVHSHGRVFSHVLGKANVFFLLVLLDS